MGPPAQEPPQEGQTNSIPELRRAADSDKTPDPNGHARPTAIDDPWTRLLTPLLEKDNARCEVWKDEVQNVLIFAGLFSAVVTAFIIESYKSLRKDPVEILLTRLLIKMGEQDARELSTDALSLPDGAATLINTLWFLSLVLSLVTVLIGTISLQWLREHQRNHVGLEPQIAFSLHHMQVEALDAWFVPEVFTLLCLILQTAVVLFLFGLTKLLWILNRTVCIYVAVVVAITLCFLLSTTVLPTFQALSLFLPRNVAKPRSPCPYKAPQAWVFHCLVSLVVNTLAPVFGGSRKWPKLDSRGLLSTHARDFKEGKDPHTFPRATGILFRSQRNDSWLEHGIAWLFQRDSDYISLGPRDTTKLPKRPVPLYDSVQGLLDMKNAELADLRTVAALDSCIEMVLKSNDVPLAVNEATEVGLRTCYGRFFKRLSTAHPLPFGVPHGTVVDLNDDFDLLVSDAALRLCSRTDGFDRLPFEVGRRALRSCVHITEWMYGREVSTPYKTAEGYMPPQTLPIQFVAEVIVDNEITGGDLEEVQCRVRKVLDQFLGRIAGSKSILGQQDSLDTHDQYVARFLRAAVRILTYGCEGSRCEELLEGLNRQSSNSDFTYQVRPFIYFLLLDSGVPVTDSLRRSVEAVYHTRDVGRTSKSLPLWRFIRWERFQPFATPKDSASSADFRTTTGLGSPDEREHDPSPSHGFRSDTPFTS